MTIDEMRKSDDLLLSPEEVGSALGISPQGIRNQASIDPRMLGFNTIRVGVITKIPRVPLLKFLGVID